MSGSNEKGFFDRLRHLCNEINSSSTTLKSRIEAPAQTDYSSTAVVKLKEMKKEVRSLKKESENILANCQKETVDFDCLLSACQNFVESSRAAAVGVEDFMKQYGYTAWEEVTVQKAEDQKNVKKEDTSKDSSPELKAQQDSMAGDDAVQTPESKPSRSQKGTPKLEDFLSVQTIQALWLREQKEVTTDPQADKQTLSSDAALPIKQYQASPSVPEEFSEAVKTPLSIRTQTKPQCGTPQLEDFGLSDQTMQLINTLKTSTCNPSTVPPTFKPESFSTVSYESPWQKVPSKFINDGLVVTPSIGNGRPFGTETPAYHIGGAYGFEVEESPYQPSTDMTKPQLPQWRSFRARDPETDKHVNMKLEDHFNVDDTVSSMPAPPKLMLKYDFMRDENVTS